MQKDILKPHQPVVNGLMKAETMEYIEYDIDLC